MDHLEIEVIRILVYEKTEDPRYPDGVKHMEKCSACRMVVQEEKKNNPLVAAALMSYTKTISITYAFKAGGKAWVVTSFTDTLICFGRGIENSQGNAHMSAEAFLEFGRWKLEHYTRRSIETHEGAATANDIEAYFNEHGPPRE